MKKEQLLTQAQPNQTHFKNMLKKLSKFIYKKNFKGGDSRGKMGSKVYKL